MCILNKIPERIQFLHSTFLVAELPARHMVRRLQWSEHFEVLLCVNIASKCTCLFEPPH